MRRVLVGIDSISKWSGKVVSAMILIIIGVMLYEIVSRYLFRAPTIWAHETSQQLFGAYSVLAGAYVLLQLRHVKVDIIYTRFSPRTRAILDSVTYLMFFLFIGVMAVHGAQIAWHSVEINELSQFPWTPPIWPLKLTVPIAAFLMLLQGLAHFTRALSIAIRGRELA